MTLTSTLAALAMAFGAPLVYADQAWSIQKRRNSDGFSKDVCAVLLIANICRCFFWFGERFEFPLLLQSILMIAAQLFLLSLLIKFRPGSYASSSFSVASGDRSTHPRSGHATSNLHATSSTTTFSADDADNIEGLQFSSNGEHQEDAKPGNTLGSLFGPSSSRYAPLFGNVKIPIAPTLDEDEEEERPSSSRANLVTRLGKQALHFLQGGIRLRNGTTRRDGSSGGRPFGFWTWPNYSSYVLFLLVLVFILAVAQILLGSFHTYTWLLGFFALGLESTLPVPQAIQNYQRKSLSGFRLSVLLGWLGGDIFKTLYFIIQKSPLQFTVCGMFQLSVDLIICAQMYLYREQTAREDENARLNEAEELEAGQRASAPIEDDAPTKPTDTSTRQPDMLRDPEQTPFQIEADDEDDDADLGVAHSRR